MSYTEIDAIAGKDHAGNTRTAGFRYTVNVAQGTTIIDARLHVWLERKYPASAGVVVLDHFTDTNGTTLPNHTMDIASGASWVQYENGPMTIQSNQASTGNGGIVGFDAGDANGMCQAQVSSTNQNDEVGIVFRYSDDENYWYFYHRNWNAYVKKIVGGVVTELYDSGNILGPTPNTIVMKVIMDGDDLECFIDGVSKWSDTDADLHGNTIHGIFGGPAGAIYDGLWDNFEFIPGVTAEPIIDVRADDVDDSDDFSVSLPGARVLTTNSVSFQDPTSWVEDTWNISNDVKTVVQEVIDRPGWDSGHAMSLILTSQAGTDDGERIRVTSYDGNPARAARLYLTYAE